MALWPWSARAPYVVAGEGQGEAAFPVLCWPTGPYAVRPMPMRSIPASWKHSRVPPVSLCARVAKVVRRRPSGLGARFHWETLGNGGGRGATACSGLCLTCLAFQSVLDGVGRTALWIIAAQARNALLTESAGIAAEYGH